MDIRRTRLKYALMAGAFYFLCVSLAHISGMKIPGLFIYFNIPSFQYQDSIIAVLSFGWAMFFYAASRHPENIKPLLVSAIVALLGIARINYITDFSELADSVKTMLFWIQTGILGIYVATLVVMSYKLKTKSGAH